MGFGFLESVYEKCLLIELEKAGLHALAQNPITVYYDNNVVGEFIVDVLVDDLIILELESVRRVVKAHEVQLVNYLTANRILFILFILSRRDPFGIFLSNIFFNLSQNL